MPYENVCVTFEALDKAGLTVRENIKKTSLGDITKLLSECPFRFPRQTGKFIKLFGDNPIDLSSATREELIAKIPGIGMKLASMFCRNTRGEQFAVIDVHIKSYLREQGKLSKSYLENEETLKEIALDLGLTVGELDFIIWENRRIGNKKKKSKSLSGRK